MTCNLRHRMGLRHTVCMSHMPHLHVTHASSTCRHTCLIHVGHTCLVKYVTIHVTHTWFCMSHTPHTGWRRLIGSLIFTGHFPQKWPIFSGSFVENDLQLRGSYESSPLYMKNSYVNPTFSDTRGEHIHMGRIFLKVGVTLMRIYHWWGPIWWASLIPASLSP